MRTRMVWWGAALVAGVVVALGLSQAGSGPAAATAAAAGGATPSGIVIICSPDTSDSNETCNATVGGGDGSVAPTGTVAFSATAGSGGSFPSGASCALATDSSGATATCSVTYAPAEPAGTSLPITATYTGDGTFAPSHGTPTAAMTSGNDAITGWTPSDGTEGGESGTSTLPEFNLVNLPTGGTDSITAMNMTTGVYSGTAEVSGVQFADNGVENGDFAVQQLTEGSYVSTDAQQYFLLPSDDLAVAGVFYAGKYASDQGQVPGRIAATESVACVADGVADTCTETVGGAGGTPTGNATFSDANGGSFSPTNACVLSAGSCSVQYTPPSPGAGVGGVSAVYSGDPTYDWTQVNASGPGAGATTTTTATTTTPPTTTATTTTTTTTTSKVASATEVSCDQELPESEQAGEPGIAYLACTATVSGADGTGVAPSGSVTFRDVAIPPSVAFAGLNTCALKASTSGPTAYCTVDLLPSANPIPTAYEPPIVATYSGDTNFGSSSASPQLGPGPEGADNPEDPQGQDNPTDPNGADPTVATVPVTVSVDPSVSGPTTVTTSGSPTTATAAGSSTSETTSGSLADVLVAASWDVTPSAGDQLRGHAVGTSTDIHWLVCRRKGATLVCSLGTVAAHEKVKVHLLFGFTPAAAGQTKHLSVVARETVKGRLRTLAHATRTVRVPRRTVLSVSLTPPKAVGGVDTVKVKNGGALAATKLRVCLSGTDGLTPLSAPGATLSAGELCLSDARLARGSSLLKAVKVRGNGVLKLVVSAANAHSVTVGI